MFCRFGVSSRLCSFARVGGLLQDEESIYFIMEYVQGGELFAHLRAAEGHRLTESRARFYVSEIILALQYMHEEVCLDCQYPKPVCLAVSCATEQYKTSFLA